MAYREVLKWIVKRDAWLVKRAQVASRPAITFRSSPDPDTVGAALLLGPRTVAR
jgi:hypothetical protein